MKMLYLSLGWLLVIILIWSLLYYCSIEKAIDYFDAELKKAYIASMGENYNEVQLSINKILDYWKKTEKLWIYFVHQGDIDDIGASILKIDAYAKSENKAMILSEIEELKKFLRMVKGNESLSLENIF